MSYPVGPASSSTATTLYGTTYNFGTGTGCNSRTQGCGTVWRLTNSGSTWTYTVLYTFNGGSSDGANPAGPLTVISARLSPGDGRTQLYGTTSGGGGSNSYGTVFELTGTPLAITYIHNLKNDGSEGSDPQGALVGDAHGGYFFTAEFLGGGDGDVDDVAQSGSKFSDVYNFTGGTTDGAAPVSAVTYDFRHNIMYGATYSKGSSNHGVIYKIINP
jgi:hypothetical protein